MLSIDHKKKAKSPSHTYVAICYHEDFSGVKFKKFTATPEQMLQHGTDNPSWYFMNVVDFVACVEDIITFEEYSNLIDLDNPTVLKLGA